MAKKTKKGDPVSFIRSQPWTEWWVEFTTEMNRNGGFKYPTVWSFICSRTRVQEERVWLYAAIGPVVSEKKYKVDGEEDEDGWKPAAKLKRVPWIGDWQQKRMSGLLFRERTATTLDQVLEERGSALEAARGVAQVSVDWLARFNGLAAQVDEYFGGQVLRGDLSDKENNTRMEMYLQWQNEAQKLAMRAQRMFLLCHGIREDDDVSMLMQMVGLGARAALAGTAAGAALTTGEGDVMEKLAQNPVIQMVQAMAEKSRIFKMPLPEENVVVEEPVRKIRN